jgi:hypothetical protein
LKNHWDKLEIKKKNKKYQNFWNKTKAIIRRNSIAINVYIKRVKREPGTSGSQLQSKLLGRQTLGG